MLADEPIDEDLEALLYAQVYYGREEEAEVPHLTGTEILIDKDQTEAESIEPNNRHWHQKKRYFENNLIQEDKNKETTDILRKEITLYTPVEEDININSINHPELGSERNSDQISEDQTVPIEGEENLESIPIEQLPYFEISTSPLSTNPILQESLPIVSTAVLTAPNESTPPQVLNNITINQYLYPPELPPSFLKRLESITRYNPLSNKCQRDLNKYKKGCITEQEFFYNLKRRIYLNKSKHRQVKKTYDFRPRSLAQTPVICLSSDTEDSDIEVVEVTQIPKVSSHPSSIMNEKVDVSIEESENEAEDEDEIIYIEPPPVPVINVDSESDSESLNNDQSNLECITEDPQTSASHIISQNVSDNQLDPEETSDDFLQPKKTPDNFNFSLHGSDFHETDFVKPSNPTDVYETESSTSTSDFNRESTRQFCNTVKTIVFNEVEFPNQDIFDESNLESFGELITPKRSDKENSKETQSSPIDKVNDSSSTTCINQRSPSESSSESEYETSNAHQNLPDLSPMVYAESSPKKGNKSKKKAAETPKNDKVSAQKEGGKKNKSKKKSKEKAPHNGNEEIAGSEELKKLKRKSCEVVSDEVPRKKSKKKKNKSDISNHPGENVDRNLANASLKKKLTGGQVADGTTPKKNVGGRVSAETVQGMSPKTKTKKKRKPTDENEGDEELEQENVSVDNGKKRNKKRKQKGSSETVLESPSNEKEVFIEEVDESASFNKEDPSVGDSNVSQETDSSDGGKKNKRKKISSTDKRSSGEDCDTSYDGRQDSGCLDSEQIQILEAEKMLVNSSERVIVETEVQEGVILVEPVIPVHTIESSDSEDDDVLSLGMLGNDLILANIETQANINFDLKGILDKMSDDPEKWKILSIDHYKLNIPKKGPRCRKCREYGHMVIHCPNKPTLQVCTLCGESGHQEPRCPNKVCLTCGKPGNFSTVYCKGCVYLRKHTCNLCYLIGHHESQCPDLWRRYFLTTTAGNVKRPHSNKQHFLKPPSEQWCSGCASRGHLEYECNTYKWMREYPVSSPYIFDFDNVYGESWETKKKKKKRETKKKKKQPRTPEEELELQQRLQYQQLADSLKAKRKQELAFERRRQKHEIIAERIRMLDRDLEQCADSTEGAEHLHQHQQVGEEVTESLITEGRPGQDPIYEPETTIESTPLPNALNPPTRQVQHAPQRATRERQPHQRSRKRGSQGNAMINPLSLMGKSMGYTPYRGVLNPAWLMGVQTQTNAHNQNLFNTVPNDILVQQLRNLACSVVNQQNQGCYNHQSLNRMNYQQQFPQVLPNSTQDLFSFYDNRSFQDLPYTITRDPMEEGETVDGSQTVDGISNIVPATSDFGSPQPLMDIVFDEAGGSRQNTFQVDSGNFGAPKPLMDVLVSEPEALRQNTFEVDSGNSYKPNYITLETPENVSSISNYQVNVDPAISRKFNTCSSPELKNLINNELERLSSLAVTDPKAYKKKLYTTDHLKKVQFKTSSINKQLYHLFKQINMFIFGYNRKGEANRHLRYLQYFVYSYKGPVGNNRRKRLLKSFSYIFGGENPDFNYRRCLNTMTVINKPQFAMARPGKDLVLL